mmetsp:Transcript_6130/g.13235  ORF Transcript_6130/g.13235 Transcript_6130/m.13235 type:complete len:200 (-) Transcript_6130:1086-1685(-)
MGGSSLLVRPKSSKTGTDESPGTAVDTNMLAPCGSALNRPPTCIWMAQARQIRSRSSSRSTPCWSIESVSFTGKPRQKSITKTRSRTKPGIVSGTIAVALFSRSTLRTSCMFCASILKSNSFLTSLLYSRMTGPKSRSGSVLASNCKMTRRFSMSCNMSDATPRCCTLRTTSWGDPVVLVPVSLSSPAVVAIVGLRVAL